MFVMRAGPAPAVHGGRMRARDLAHFLGVGGAERAAPSPWQAAPGGRAGSQRSRGAGFISARRRRLGGRACACDASWSQNTGMGLALPH